MVIQTAEFSVVHIVNRIVFGCAAVVSEKKKWVERHLSIKGC